MKDRSVTHFGDGKTELAFYSKEKDPALMSARAWLNMGAVPFEDPEFTEATKASGEMTEVKRVGA